MVEAISKGLRVFIRDAEKEDEFDCEHCRDAVRPVQGIKMPWHFWHVENDECIGTEENPAGVGY